MILLEVVVDVNICERK